MARLFLTGGSGLLGHTVAKVFREAGWEVVAPTHAELELTDWDALQSALDSAAPELIINCAAQRRPDLCEAETPAVRALNCELPERLAKTQLPCIHLSTDYVFNGANAPYETDARRSPINAYGRQKAMAEAALEDFEKVLILRVPILYGPTDDWRSSAVTVLAANLVAAKGASVLMDDIAIRYPTSTVDIARQLLRLAPHIGKLRGIYHYSGDEPMTKFLMAMTMAPLVGCSPKQCLQDLRPPTVPRPYDGHLSVRKLQQTGLYHPPTPFREAIREVLQ